MLARHRGRDSVLHCGGSDGAPADALPHPDGGTLNPAGLRCWVAMVLAALWWCALVVLVRERCGSVWWCACVGSLWCGVPVGVPLCCGALLVLVSVGWAPRVCGRGGSTCWGVPQLWCATGSQGHPPPWSVRLTRWCVLGCVRPGPWCLAVLVWRHGAPTSGVLHIGGPYGLPLTAGVGELKARPEQTLRAVSVGRSRDPSCGGGSPPGESPSLVR